MIKIENVETYGWRAALWGMRNPKNSWGNSDTKYIGNLNRMLEGIGDNDLKLAQKLADAGPVHGKFLRMIIVSCDITAPLYWWKEYDTYKVGTVCNSCSTMHKIADKEFTPDDFSHEHLLNEEYFENSDELSDLVMPETILEIVISTLNIFRDRYKECKQKGNMTQAKIFWWQMIQLLPSSYNQRRTVQMNYAVLRNMYEYRKDHKLDEWREYCGWIEGLPYSELITGVRS